MIDNFFNLQQRGSTILTEILAGLSTFLSLSYIFVVNPAILANAGMDKSFVLFATIIVSASATIAMGLWARLPFVLAPGMEMNAYVAFFVVGTLGFTWQEALGGVFWSGILFMLLTVFKIRENIISAIPHRMKSALSLSVGIFLILVALRVAGILTYAGVNIEGVGSIFTYQSLTLFVGLVIVLVLDKYKIQGAVLLSIIIATVLCHLNGIGMDSEKPILFSDSMFDGIGQLELGVIMNPKIISAILVLFLVDFYGSVAKFIGLTLNTGIIEKGKLPRMRQALSIDGIATLLGAGLGTTSVTTYVESGVGIGIGARTGLSSIICGVLMLSCFFVTPLLQYIPVVATTGALIFVGIKLCPSIKVLKSYPSIDLLVIVLMQITVIATFAIDKAMLVGFLSYIIADVYRKHQPSKYLIGSTILLLIGSVFQLI